MQMSAEAVLGAAIALTAAMTWGLSTNIYKSQSDDATPLSINAIKMWISGIVMTLIVIIPFRTTPFFVPWQSAIFLIASVTIGLVVGDFVYLTSQERIGVSYAFPISNVFPITTYLIALVLVGEQFILSRFFGIILAITGIGLISRAQEKNNEGDINKTDFIGIGLALTAALCWSVGTVFLQIGVEGIDPIDANFLRMVFGSAVMIPIVAAALKGGMPKPPARSTKIILIGGFFGMAIGSLLYTYAVSLVGAAVSAVLGSTSPLFALPISIFVLKERYTAQSLGGAMLTVLGVMIVILAF